jgi:hypothetical protein
MPEIEAIWYACEPSEESVVHKYPKISRIYESIYSNRPESWNKWESIWTHRIGVCEIWGSSDDPEIGKYRYYRYNKNSIPQYALVHITVSRNESSNDDPHDRIESKYERTIVREPDTENTISWRPWERYPERMKPKKYTNISNYRTIYVFFIYSSQSYHHQNCEYISHHIISDEPEWSVDLSREKCSWRYPAQECKSRE